MSALLQDFWRDESGLILSAELVMILTIGVLGLLVGLANVQNAVLGELNDIGLAFRSLNQSFSTPSFHGCWKGGCWPTSYTMGSCFVDIYEPGCVLADMPANGAVSTNGCELNSGFGCYLPPAPSTVCPPSTTAPQGSTTPAATPSANPLTPTDAGEVLPPRSAPAVSAPPMETTP